ncbi:MAG: helix-turn-helix domain-containing protein [Proteobacteria bacterium]|nr:helix-turn-helix domain-containing protein [Pseudomonadota bacterium]
MSADPKDQSENFYLTGESVSDSKPYEYRTCGLDGIFLLNGFEMREHDGELHVSINEIDELHLAIGKHLVTHRKALVPKEIRFLRKTMGMSQADLAEVLGKTSQSVARWEKGTHDIPGSAEKLLRAIFVARSLMDDDDLETLRTLLVEKLGELDAIDELQTRPVQFSLTNHWTENEAA